MVNLDGRSSSGHIWGIDEVFCSFLINSPWSTHIFLGMFFHAESCISLTLVNIYDEDNNKIYCLEMENSNASYSICLLCFGTTSIKIESIRSDLIGSLTLKLILVLMIYVSNLYLKSVDHLCCWLVVIILRPKGFVSEKIQTCRMHVSLKWCYKNYFLN